MEVLFVGLAGGLLIAVLLIYIRNVLYTNIGMNLSTWLIATLAALIQNVTYYSTVGGRGHLLIVPTIMSAGLIAITVLGWRKSTFGQVNRLDIMVFAGTMLCLAVWLIFDGVVANVVLQFALFTSFIPTMRDLRAKKFEDDAFPWGLASFGYIFQLIAVVISIQVLSEDWPRLINPILVGLIGNGLVSWTAFWSKRQTQNK
ncbi:MAG: hypothetical protein UT30_C0001G0001 [Candidatus Uhrbacteria bacterium GW2011_GWF2_39_13]|uniref:Uncharacterized protein n=1 Tax=Candidatus Uhrbacteria bacterium GW2011_GWF2_39_13 TaxID=1618995 RepID=A0A0G0QTU9_9BACT|nr:MAG: hypothetical protein UT30_C0001G0001 [Candidatus Uhrbacteria bacterium GW2011_GWF2_39_13]HAU65947.1 hypothetical protein [Candidatus Uhrbacteria bacterium]